MCAAGNAAEAQRIFLRSAEELLMRVIKKIMLLGQNVNSYGNDLPSGTSFSELLKLVCRTGGIERIRFMTSHPKDLSDDLIEVMASEPKILQSAAPSIQSGSNKVLKEMNRGYRVSSIWKD